MKDSVLTAHQSDVPLASDDFSHSLPKRKSLNRAHDRMVRFYWRIDDTKSPQFVRTFYRHSLQRMTLESGQATKMSVFRAPSE